MFGFHGGNRAIGSSVGGAAIILACGLFQSIQVKWRICKTWNMYFYDLIIKMIGRQIFCNGDYFTRYSAGPWHEQHKLLSGEDGADSDDVRTALILWLSSREHRRTEVLEQE